ncbi:MAG: type II secretion system protein GspD [Phycisphaerales bacterium]|nr:type II secretion system protein GspD [Phycisphaerales bacterium]
MALIGSLWVAGCAQSQEQTRVIELESPRTSGGLVVTDGRKDGLDRIARILENYDSPAISAGVLSSIQDRIAHNEFASITKSIQAASPQISAIKDLLEPITLPAQSGRLISLGRMSVIEINDLITSMSLRFQTEHSYLNADPQQLNALGAPPAGVSSRKMLVRNTVDGGTSYLRLGFASYVSQLPQLWVQGVVVAQDGSASVNPLLDGIQTQVDTALEQMKQMRSGLAQGDLDRKVIQLSYVNTKGALSALKGLGINTTPAIEGLGATLEFAQLPMVTVMPSPTDEQIGLVSTESGGAGSFGQTTTPSKAGALNPEVYAGPTSQLMVLFHPAHPEQFSLVRSILDEYIDRPARQVFIEGMVLEISESGLDELGIEWSFKEGSIDFLLGSLDPTGITDTVTFSSLDSRDVVRDWGTTIRALVRDGKAEILSRPSILTMNNRQATIRVGEDIPIATSQEGVLNNSNKVAFNFKYIPTGILLNIRPRITESGDEVSMLIDTVVSAQVPGRDLEIRSIDGDLLASAPTISTRRVQTYARIDNNTPFIIGGLVSRDRSVTQDKVPFLGDLPLIGPAFRSKRVDTQKREVIIVLTPYVLPDEHAITRTLPKDDELFDSTGNKLFRDAFRIHAEDVFDLRFLAENKRLMIYRELAKDLIASNFKLAYTAPFNEFAEDTIPGEEILIERMIYEVIKRTQVDNRVNPGRIIYFEAKEYEGYNVRFLDYALTRLGDGLTPESFFERNTGKAIAITYTYSRESLAQQDLASEPIPDIALVDCPDRDTWQQLLWDMNQPSSDGIDRYTILIHQPKDIVRLQRALMLKKIIQLNGGDESLSLKHFSTGKILHVPEMGEEKVSVIDADVAKYFFHTELYYAAIIKRIEETLKAFDQALEDPAIQMYLGSKHDSLRSSGGR